MLVWILVFTFLGSFVSLAVAAMFLWRKEVIEGRTHLWVAFAAGAMLSASFLDLLPEALEKVSSVRGVLEMVLFGIIVFFFFERFLLLYHHHNCPEGKKCQAPVPAIPLLIFGDSLHNFLDGTVIAAAFLVSLPLGVITSLAVFFHEIPHELGNFGALLALGMRRGMALLVNIFSALLAFLGAFLSFYFLTRLQFLIPFLIAFAAGNFIYIASSDLIPEIHRAFKREKALSQTGFFILGILVIWLTTKIFAA